MMNITNLGILRTLKNEMVGYFLNKTKKLYWEECRKFVYERGIDSKKNAKWKKS